MVIFAPSLLNIGGSFWPALVGILLASVTAAIVLGGIGIGRSEAKTPERRLATAGLVLGLLDIMILLVAFVVLANIAMTETKTM